MSDSNTIRLDPHAPDDPGDSMQGRFENGELPRTVRDYLEELLSEGAWAMSTNGRWFHSSDGDITDLVEDVMRQYWDAS